MKTVMIDIAKIRPSETNDRIIQQKALEEFAESIKANGILEPILVQAERDGFHTIIAGERRYRAGVLAGLKQIPCIIHDVMDEQAQEMRIIENLQRADLHPLEEAKAIQRLLKETDGFQEVAARIGKSKAYVYRRTKLLNLHPTGQAALKAGTLSLFISERLAMLSPAEQNQILKESSWNGQYDDDRIANALEQATLLLGKAPFKTGDATLSGGSCKDCKKRTGHEPDLFGDAGKKDSCLDAGCWRKKVTENQKRVVEKFKAAGKKVIEGDKAAEMIREHAFADLNDTAQGIKGEKTLKSVLNGIEIESTICVHDGKVHELVNRNQAMKAIPKKFLESWAIPTTEKSGPSPEAAEKKKEELRKATVNVEAEAAAGKLAKVDIKGTVLRGLVDCVYTLQDSDSNWSALKRIIPDSERSTADKKFKALVASASDAELKGYLGHLLIGSGDRYGFGETAYTKIKKTLSIDSAKCKERAKAERV